MSRKVDVGNLPYATTDADLRELFAPFGTVLFARAVADAATGRSLGFAFVEMSSPAEALAAVAGVHDRAAAGRTLTVNLARPRERAGGVGVEAG
jgi:RNA recognition motif-containing protein